MKISDFDDILFFFRLRQNFKIENYFLEHMRDDNYFIKTFCISHLSQWII